MISNLGFEIDVIDYSSYRGKALSMVPKPEGHYP